MPKKSSTSSRLTVFLVVTVLLVGLGLFFVFESSTAESFTLRGHPYHFVNRQAMWLAVGLVGAIAAYLTPIAWFKKAAGLFYLGSLFLLSLVFVPGLGLELNGARRWIDLGFVPFQPIELAKLALIIFFAKWMSRHQRLGPFVFLTGLPSLILLLQPDMGSLLILLVISLGLYFLAGGGVKKLLPVGIIGFLLLVLAVVASPYRLKRLKTYLNPDIDPLGSSFHIKQITLALGNGGWLGQGLGNSKQKYAYIPEASSDSIFAIVGEEVGFVGSSLILILFASYFYLGYQIAQSQDSGSFEQLTAWGILIWLAAQTMLNLAAVVALVPLTGLPLPFFSYGGTSLVMALVGTGLLVKLARVSKN
ncbi:MAG: stage V sporulation protein E [Candidatus Pacebacteria bacterium]|nr:stage V sporulation protein E [Candidatus Paceibacterota bacterium]